MSDKISGVDWDIPSEAAELHRSALVCDLTLPFADIGDPRLKNQTLPRFVNSGVNSVSLSVGGDAGSAGDTLKLLARERARVKANPESYRLVEVADDIRQSKQDGTLAVSFHFQGTNPLEGSLEMIAAYYELGVRHMALAYNTRNRVGDGCFEPTDGGLSIFGRRVVREMNRVGMLVDGSHTGRRTSHEAMELSDSPFIFSHANPAGVFDHVRNINDDQIRHCAESGGVVGIMGISAMLGPENLATIELMVRHIDYVVQLVGIDHVGLSLDFVYDTEATYWWALAEAGGELPAKGNYRVDMPLVQPEDYPRITAALLLKGYAPDDIRKILGGNWFRVASQVWK